MHDYELLDCGDFRRLERFGSVVVDRPARQASWPKKLAAGDWRRAHAVFADKPGSSPSWRTAGAVPEEWTVSFDYISLNLRLSSGGQVGVFPEQLETWQWIRGCVEHARGTLLILNAFGYTGAATLAAAGVSTEGTSPELCHVDASRSAVSRARRNAALSGLAEKPIRWIVEDTVLFLEREVRRGRRYEGLILDPPAFGRSRGRRTWVFRRDLPRLLELSGKLLGKTPLFITLSCHEPGVTTEELAGLLSSATGLEPKRIECAGLIIPSRTGNSLPCGICARWRSSR